MSFDASMYGTPESVTGVGTNSGVTVTLAASGNKTHAATGLAVSGDLACIVTIESPTGTVKWRKRFTAAFHDAPDIGATPILGAAGSEMILKISASTAACEATLIGQAI